MLLVYPPVARSPEPPLGIARLAGLLSAAGEACACLDLNQEALERLLALPLESDDPGARGALRRRQRSLAAMRDMATYRNLDRYKRAVSDLELSLGVAGSAFGASIGLADYHEESRSPARRADLLEAARDFADSPYYSLFEERLGPAIEEELPSRRGVLGISLCFLSQALPAFALAGFAKARFPGLKIVLGGSLVGSWSGQGLLPAGEDFGGLFDALLPGRGEDSLPRYLGLSAEGRGEADPAFDDFGGLGYLSPARILPLNLSSGCPFRNCAFCPEKAEGRPYLAGPPDRVVSWAARAVERHRPGLVHFSDSEIAPSFLRALAERPPGAPWYGFARFSPELLDAGFCRALAGSGCVMLQLGFESADQDVLDAMGKGTRAADFGPVLRNLAEAGIGAYLYALFGTPGEDRGAALRTRDFLEENAGLIGFVNAAIFNLPAASEEARSLTTRPYSEGELSLYREFSHPLGWNRDAIRRFLAEDMGRSPGIRAILSRTPPSFTSSHAPFFLPGATRLAPGAGEAIA